MRLSSGSAAEKPRQWPFVVSPSRTLYFHLAQFLRYQDDNTDTANVRPAGGIQNHTTPDINISEALRASGVKQRKTIANLTLDL